MNSNLKWYVVRSVNGKEKKVKQYLEADINRLGIQAQIMQVIIPMEKYFTLRNGKKIEKERTLFPGYVLIEAQLDAELEYIIKNTNSVIGFLADKDGIPIPMRSSEVKRFLGVVDELSEKEASILVDFSVGEIVKVIDGPFADFEGEIEEIQEERKKLVVRVKVFGRPTPLELDYIQVEKI